MKRMSVKWQLIRFVQIQRFEATISSYQSIWDNPLADGDLLYERETENSHDPQAMHGYEELIDGTPAASCWHVPKKCVPINLFDIHVRLYRCVKYWMVKIWQIFGRSSILPNFIGTKVSLHTVENLYTSEESRPHYLLLQMYIFISIFKNLSNVLYMP